jgi:hypothetical protein
MVLENVIEEEENLYFVKRAEAKGKEKYRME